MTVLQEYVCSVTNRTAEYAEAEDYYEGRVPEVFASARLRHALRTTGYQGMQNYCRPVVDAVLHRLEIANIVADTKAAQTLIDEVWLNNELGLEGNEIHRAALEYGDCYALVWPDAEGEWKISYNSPRNTALVYDPEDPTKKLYAVKMWTIKADPLTKTNAKTRMNVYTVDYIHKFETEGDTITEGVNWKSVGQEDNPFGEIPVFHFRTHRPYGKPEHKEAYGPQNDINKLLATHFYSIDYQGAPQRYALTMSDNGDLVDFNEDDTDRENISALKNGPGELWYLKGVNQVGQFNPADPDSFWKPINNLKQCVAALTDTPFHYLEKSVNVSGGESLRVAEAPLLKKVGDRQTSFGVTWRELFKFILKNEGKATAKIEVKWDVVESFDSLDVWDMMLKKINAGLSHAQALREAGYEENDIQRILQERNDEAQSASTSFYNRTDANGQQSLQNAPQARTSTADNAPNNENRNGLTEDAKVNGGRGTK